MARLKADDKFKLGDKVVCVRGKVKHEYPTTAGGGHGWTKGRVFKVVDISDNDEGTVYWGGKDGSGVYEDWLAPATSPKVEKIYKQLRKAVEDERRNQIKAKKTVSRRAVD